MHMKFLSLAGLCVVSLVLLSKTTLAEPSRTCQYNPDSGVPNPLGMRAYITVTEEKGDTTFLFEQFPSPVASSSRSNSTEQVTIASSRALTFYGVGIDRARTLMLQNPKYYAELVGYDDPEGFAPVNAVLACR
ncbi:MAG TPA: hypothetical protein V6C57_13185 [Coleofasciculaceae cyanobacterium]